MDTVANTQLSENAHSNGFILIYTEGLSVKGI